MKNITIFFLFIALLAIFTTTTFAAIDPKLSDVLVEVTDDTRHLLDSGVWLVDVYATWCGHCTQLKPKIIELAQQVLRERDPVTFAKTKIALINGPENPILQTRYIKRGYPTLALVKNGVDSDYRGLRTTESLHHHLKQFSEPDVRALANRAHFKRALGTVGQWNNLFIYLGPNVNSHGAFHRCAAKFQTQAHFYSPYGAHPDHTYKLLQSIWDVYPGNYDKQYEINTIDEKVALEDLADFFHLNLTSLPVILNYPVGREVQLIHGPFDSALSHEEMCNWIESHLKHPIEQLSTYNYAEVIDYSDTYVLMAVENNNAQDIQQLSVLPTIAQKYNYYYDYFVWTLSPLIPKIRTQFGIPSYKTNFIVVVDYNPEVEQFFVIDEADFQQEEKVLDVMRGIRNGTIAGQSLYSNPFQRYARKLTFAVNQLSTSNNMMAMMGVVVLLFILFFAGAVYILCSVDSHDEQAAAGNQQRDVLQQKMIAQQQQAKEKKQQEKAEKEKVFIDSSRAAKIPQKPAPSAEGGEEDVVRKRK